MLAYLHTSATFVAPAFNLHSCFIHHVVALRYSCDLFTALHMRACSCSFQQSVAACVRAFRVHTITVTDWFCFGLTAADHDDELEATSGRNLLGTTYYYSYHNYHEPSAAAAAAAAAGGDSAAAAAAASSGMPCFLPLLDR